MPGKELGNGGRTLGSVVGKPEGIWMGGNVLGMRMVGTVGKVGPPASVAGGDPVVVPGRGPGPGVVDGVVGAGAGPGRAWSSGVMTASLGSGRFGGGVGAGSRGVWGTSTTATAPSAATTLSESASRRPIGLFRR
jgi:hypothetical protein